MEEQNKKEFNKIVYELEVIRHFIEIGYYNENTLRELKGELYALI